MDFFLWAFCSEFIVYTLIGTDMLAAVLPASERAELDMDFTEGLIELFPECATMYFENSGHSLVKVEHICYVKYHFCY